MPTPRTIKTRLLILSDTHSAVPALRPTQPFHDPLPAADVLLHCGDLTYAGGLSEYASQLSYLRAADAELKLVIAGNHDVSLDAEYYARRARGTDRVADKFRRDLGLPGQAKGMWEGEEAKGDGVRYLEEGVHGFRLRNGALLKIYASPYQPEFCNWAFPYPRDEDHWNSRADTTPGHRPACTNPIPDFPDVDVVMTHGPPRGILDRNFMGTVCGCTPLLHAMHRARPQIHCFGHIHEGNGAVRVRWARSRSGGDLVETAEGRPVDYQQAVRDGGVHVDCSSEGAWPVVFGESTLFVNAAIRTVGAGGGGQEPIQPPWLVDIDLPDAGDEPGLDERAQTTL